MIYLGGTFSGTFVKGERMFTTANGRKRSFKDKHCTKPAFYTYFMHPHNPHEPTFLSTHPSIPKTNQTHIPCKPLAADICLHQQKAYLARWLQSPMLNVTKFTYVPNSTLISVPKRILLNFQSQQEIRLLCMK